jgi:hypothetical protein
LVKQLLAGPAEAAAVLQTLLPPEIARALDWSSLQPATREMPAKGRASTHTDLVFRVRLAEAVHPVDVLLYVLIEHQSTPDPTMPVRVLAGLTGLWRSWPRNPSGRPLPLVIPLVLAHTEQGWKAPRSMDARRAARPLDARGHLRLARGGLRTARRVATMPMW